jgi:hypothetical protein
MQESIKPPISPTINVGAKAPTHKPNEPSAVGLRAPPAFLEAEVKTKVGKISEIRPPGPLSRSFAADTDH